MIKRYLDFINESLELILESDVVYSDNLKKVLTKIEHPLAKTILDIESKDLPVRNNYFDIQFDKNDKLTFIPDRKAQEILADTKEFVRFNGSGGGWLKHKETNQSIFDQLGYTYEEGQDPYSPNSSDVGEVIAKVTSETSGKTYAWVKFQNGQGVYNTEKLSAFDNRAKEVWQKGRQDIFVGRGIRALLTTAGVKITDKELEDFVNQFKAMMDRFNDKFRLFDVVNGDDIGHYYNYKNYFERKGTLGSSCMSNVSNRFFDIYMTNTDVCSLIIFKSVEDDTKITGRALLWKLSDGKEFVDRIYTINDSDVQLFRDYAKENGWYVKYYNSSSDSGRAIDPKTGDMVDLGTITVDIKAGEYDGYPYLDTLKYFNPRKGTLSNQSCRDCYSLESTDGDLWRCEYCNGSGRQTCSDCDGDGEYDCYRCGGSGQRKCGECDGSGQVDGEEGREECPSCDGKGEVECSSCDGSGREECSECRGRGDHSCYECQ